MIGGLLWVMGAAQVFLGQLIVQAAWRVPYSWATYNISDLGNVHCGPWDVVPRVREVCSPLHTVMNGSFALTGVALLAGLALLWPHWRPGAAGWLGRLSLLAGGMGWLLVGLNPADVNENPHVLGAALVFLVTNPGLIWAGLSVGYEPWRRWRFVVVGLGVLGLLGSLLFLAGQSLGLGLGGMERVAAYPHLLALMWLGWLAWRGERRVAA